MTDIEWCQNEDGTKGKTWNPVRGCSRVSEGCRECYAMKFAHRFSNEVNGQPGPYQGLTTIRRGKVDWAGFARLVPEMLSEPLSWRKPQRVFVNSMSDLFHESLTNAEIMRVWLVMARCPQHTFQILTKRPKRAAEWLKLWGDVEDYGEDVRLARGPAEVRAQHARGRALMFADVLDGMGEPPPGAAFPTYDWAEGPRWLPTILPNVHLGVSAEDQDTYNERVPVLAHQCPAALHWVSLEPQLGPIKLRGTGHIHLGWIVQGGESGPGARPFNIDWARSMRDECAESGIPYFLKQLGGNLFAPWKVQWVEGHNKRDDGSLDAVFIDGKRRDLATVWPNGTWHTWDANGTGGENSSEVTVELAQAAVLEALQRQHVTPIKGWARHPHMLKSRKGNDVSAWPEDLRVRQFPEDRV
jgi:protein gp37